MAQELLYTSAPRGLKPGSRGFCTVEATSGMSPALVSALEGLSAYRHIAPPGDASNPAVYSHVTLSLGGRIKSVVSRVADAGVDYTGRTNKIAYHLALDPAERPVGGPAWLAGRADVMKAGFAGEPKTLPPRNPPQGDRPLAICSAWKAATGDAGWAGVLAEAYLADANRSAYLVVPPGLDVRTLFEEAIALLPSDRGWGATFTTLYTSLPQNVTCQWRAVLAGSKEAHESRRFVQALRLDLTTRLGAATGGALVEAARTGRAVTAPPVMPKREKATSPLVMTPTAVIDDDTPLDLMPRKDSPRPERLIEPLTAPPEMKPRSGLRKAAWIAAGVVCLGVAVAPVVIVASRSISSNRTNSLSSDTEASDAKRIGPSVDEVAHLPMASTPPPETKPTDTADHTVEVADAETDQTKQPIGTPEKDASESADTGNASVGAAAAQGSVEPKKDAPESATGKASESGRGIHTVVLKSPESGDHYYTDQIISDANHSRALHFFLTRSAEDRYTIDDNGSERVTIDLKSASSPPVCQIYFAHDAGGRLVVHGDRQGKLREIPQILSLGVLKVVGDEDDASDTFLLRLNDLQPPKVPDQLSKGTVEWKLNTPKELYEVLQLNSITIEPAKGERYVFSRDPKDPRSTSLTSDQLNTLLANEVQVPDLVGFINDDPTRIEFAADLNDVWKLRLKPGAFWTTFKSQLTTSLSLKKHDYVTALREHSPPAPIERYLSFTGLRADAVSPVVGDMRARFRDAIKDATSDVTKARDELNKAKDVDMEEARRLKDAAEARRVQLEQLQSEYEQYVKAANSWRESDRDQLLHARIVDAQIAYEVSAGDASMEIPFQVDLE